MYVIPTKTEIKRNEFSHSSCRICHEFTLKNSKYRNNVPYLCIKIQQRFLMRNCIQLSDTEINFDDGFEFKSVQRSGTV